MPHPKAGTTEWLSRIEEAIVSPELPIIDPHHHHGVARGRLSS